MKPVEIYQDLYDEKDDIPTHYCGKCYEENVEIEVGMFKKGDDAYKMEDKCPKCGTNTK